MKIKQDPITKLWCREDGAILMPPTKHSKFKKFRWTYGSDHGDGYLKVKYKGKPHMAHRIICRAFTGLPPTDKPEVDHINRIRDDNRPCNLRWVDCEENEGNKASVDTSIEKYGVRCCDDKNAYHKAYDAAHREERKAYDAAKAARMKAQGLVKRKGPDGRQGWYPRIRAKARVLSAKRKAGI